MKKVSFGLVAPVVCAALAAGSGIVRARGRADDARTALLALVESERAFSRASEARGVKSAFLEFLAADAVVFRPRPASGVEVYNRYPADSPALLTWRPEYAEIASSGDLGFTTGPYAFKRSRADAEPAGFGHYISIWRLDPSGPWKVILDIGVTHPRPETSAEEVELRVNEPVAPRPATPDSGRALMDRDREFSRKAERDGCPGAYKAFAADKIRVCRDGAFPSTVDGTSAGAASGLPVRLSWEPAASGLSAAGDFGYTYGTAREITEGAGSGTPPAWSYMRIWRAAADGEWKIALEVMIPLPPPPKS